MASGRDSATIRDGILRVERSGLIIDGLVDDPNVAPGGEAYVRAQAVANQLVFTELNAEATENDVLPDTATGAGLERICALFKVYKRPAVGSIGTIIVAASASITVNVGALLIDGAGLEYKTTEGGAFDDGDPVAIIATSTGEATNQEEGAILRWVATPAFADEKVTVGIGGLVNGADAEDEEVLRQRLFARLREPPASGNAQHVAEWGEESTASVQKTFVYPAAQAAGSFHVAVTAAPTATNKSRAVAAPILTGTVDPYIRGKYPTHAASVITTVTDTPTDVAFAIAIPEAPTASPAGPGGGWLNGYVWPAPNATTSFKCMVTVVSSTTVFTVDAETPPQPLVTEICWLSPATWKLHTAKVLSFTGTSGAYEITIDTAFPGIGAGRFIWPKALNAKAYVDAVIAAYALMGPGEKTTNAGLLSRAFRHPRPIVSWPSSLGTHLTQALTDAQKEVSSATFLYRTDGTTTLTLSTAPIIPQIPGVITSPPRQYIPRDIAFYRAP